MVFFSGEITIRPLMFSRKTAPISAALLLIAVAVVASEIGGYYYIQSLYFKKSLTGQGGNGPSGAGSDNGTGTSTLHRTIAVSTLMSYGNGTSRWFNETNVPVGSNFYSFTFTIANGRVEALYYPTLNAHYIIGIDGVRNDGDGVHCTFCWTLWMYCKTDGAWSLSLLGADDIILRDGNILAWDMQDNSQSPLQPPQAGAKTVPLCSG